MWLASYQSEERSVNQRVENVRADKKSRMRLTKAFDRDRLQCRVADAQMDNLSIESERFAAHLREFKRLYVTRMPGVAL